MINSCTGSLEEFHSITWEINFSTISTRNTLDITSGHQQAYFTINLLWKVLDFSSTNQQHQDLLLIATLVSTVLRPMKMVFTFINQIKQVTLSSWVMLISLLSDIISDTFSYIHAFWCLLLSEQLSCQEDGPCKNISHGTQSSYHILNKSFSTKLFHSVKLVNSLLILKTLRKLELITSWIHSCGTMIDSIQTWSSEMLLLKKFSFLINKEYGTKKHLCTLYSIERFKLKYRNNLFKI